MSLKTRRQRRQQAWQDRQLSIDRLLLIDRCVVSLLDKVESAPAFEDGWGIGIAWAGLEGGAVDLAHLSRYEPKPYLGGVLDTQCQLDLDSARAGVLTLAWYRLVGFHRRGAPFFDANTFCDATGADDLRDDFVAIEQAWDEMANDREKAGFLRVGAALDNVYRSKVQCQPPLDFDGIRLVTVGTTLTAMQMSTKSYFDFLLGNPIPMDVRRQVNFYQRFLSYKKTAARP